MFSFLKVKIYSHISNIFCLGFLNTDRKRRYTRSLEMKKEKTRSSGLVPKGEDLRRFPLELTKVQGEGRGFRLESGLSNVRPSFKPH